MAENVKALRRRLRSIRNTRQITRAMEMVSAAKLRRAQETLMAGRPYAAKLQELLGRLAGTRISHPLFEKREVRRRLLVLITADRGLAGAFNANTIKRAEQILRESGAPSTDMVCVGRKGHDYFRTRKVNIVFSVTDLGGKLSSERTNEIAERVTELFLDGSYDEVFVLYNAFVSTLVYRTTLEKLLPLDQDALLGGAEAELPASTRNLEYIMEPSPEAVLSTLLPRFVKSKMYIIMAEVFTAEHSARMVAMSGATKNCQELMEKVSLQMNKARQAAITKEILEIVGGAEALKG